jgi:hypothetical protein
VKLAVLQEGRPLSSCSGKKLCCLDGLGGAARDCWSLDLTSLVLLYRVVLEVSFRQRYVRMARLLYERLERVLENACWAVWRYCVAVSVHHD